MLAFLTATRWWAATTTAAIVALGGALASVPVHAADHEPDVHLREGQGRLAARWRRSTPSTRTAWWSWAAGP